MKVFKKYISFCFLIEIQIKCFIYLFTFGLLTASPLLGQQVEQFRSVTCKELAQLSTDRYDYIYGATSLGEVMKFDSLGKQLAIYSPRQTNQIDLIEARQATQIFLFYEELQAFSLCDRFLGNCMEYDFSESIGYVTKATLAADGNIWLFDQDDFALKKYRMQNGQVVLENPLNLVIDETDFEVHFLREYQNKLYLVSESRCYQFDVFGNLENEWEFDEQVVGTVEWVGFYADQWYFQSSGKLYVFDLYTTENQVFNLEREYQQILYFGKDLIVGLATDKKQLVWLRAMD